MDLKDFDLTNFKKALNSLNEIIKRYAKEKNDDAIRDALVQRFEYTYSLAIKMLRRYLLLTSFEKDTVESLDFNGTIRLASSKNLLKNDLYIWNDYRQKRNMTSHIYDEKVALDIITVIDSFKEDAEFLLNELMKRINA